MNTCTESDSMVYKAVNIGMMIIACVLQSNG